ncbi:MAG: hypothetical protein Rubg2KO_23130 [Rubricoccaceae bacterium]
MSKRTATRLALVLAVLIALLAALPALAQPLRTSAFVEWGGAGVLYGLGIEQEVVRTSQADVGVRLGASAFPVLFARGAVGTLSGQLAAGLHLGRTRYAIEPSVGVSALGVRRFAFGLSSPVDTSVTAPTVGLAIRVEPSDGQRVGGRAGVTAILSEDRRSAVVVPTLGLTWTLSADT